MYEWGEHVGELELNVTAPDVASVFTEALRAFSDLLVEDDVADTTQVQIVASGSDPTVQFAAWLEELAFLAETEGLVPVAADELVIGSDAVRALVRGYRADPPHLVKAVTYHRLAFERCGDGWRAQAVLDV